MELRHLKTFAVVAEVRGFTKAAEILGYAQSSVTTQIQSLEEELQTSLFDRLGKTVVLTDSGRKLLPHAMEMLQLQETMKGLMQTPDVPSGTLTIGAAESLAAYRLPSVIKEYKRLHPQVKIILKPGHCFDLRNQAKNGQADLALILGPQTQIPDLRVETLVEEKMVLVAPLDHPLVAKGSVEAADLQDETLLHTEAGCSYRDLFDRHLEDHGVTPSTTMEFWSIEAIKNCVMSGLGLSLLPVITVEAEIRDGKLAELQWNRRTVRVYTQLLYHKAKNISPAVREFLCLLREQAVVWKQVE